MSSITARYPGPYPVFFIGASAGGVDALLKLARNLPPEFPAPLFFLLHRRRDSKHKNMLLDLLSTVSPLPVSRPEHGEVVRSGHIYLPHEGLHLAVEDNRIQLLERPDDETWRPAIDVLMKSGAREYENRAVSVLLTGDLDDGIEGMKETTYHGGITVTQSPDDAYNPTLPLNALLNDHPVYTLPLGDMPALFCELAGLQYFPNQLEIQEKAAITATLCREELRAAQQSTATRTNS